MPNWNIFADKNSSENHGEQYADLDTIPLMQEDLEVDSNGLKAAKLIYLKE